MKKLGERRDESGEVIIVEMTGAEYGTFWKLVQACNGRFEFKDFMQSFGNPSIDDDLEETFAAILKFAEARLYVNELEAFVGGLKGLLSDDAE